LTFVALAKKDIDLQIESQKYNMFFNYQIAETLSQKKIQVLFTLFTK
jgi:hypothetical protein